MDTQSDATVAKKLKAAELPLVVPPLPLLTKAIDKTFTFAFASNSPLEPNCAVADVRADRAEIWSSVKSPIVAQQTIAQQLGLPQSAVTVHVVQGGGSFGRHLFFDAAQEAAEISQKLGKPVKLMWHRTDDFRHGRTHPMSTSRVRATYNGNNVVSYEQRHTSVSTDFTHGLGEILTAYAAKVPGGNLVGFSESIFELTQSVPYNFGVVTQLLNETFNYDDFHTGSMRNIYSPNVCVATELIVDQLAAAMGKDPLAFRRSFLKRQACPGRAQQGGRGRQVGPEHAQGHGPGHRRAQRVQGRLRDAGRDRLHAGDGQPQDPRRGHRAAGDQGRDRGRRRAGRSTRAVSRRRCSAASATASRWR